MTGNDVIMANQLKLNVQEIDGHEKKKNHALKKAQKEGACLAIREDLREEGIDPFTVNGAGKLKIKHLDPLLKWKLGVATLPIDVKQSVATRHQKWLEVMNTEVPLGTTSDEVGWSDTDEERLQDLKNKAITIKDTGLERERKK